MTGAVIGTIPTAFLYFSTYEWCKEKLTAQGHSQVPSELLLLSYTSSTVGLLKLEHDFRRNPSNWNVAWSCGQMNEPVGMQAASHLASPSASANLFAIVPMRHALG